MKSIALRLLVATTSLVTSISALASCPNLSGTYQFNGEGRTEEVVIAQDRCETITHTLYWYDELGHKSFIQSRTRPLNGTPLQDPEYPAIFTTSYFEQGMLVTEVNETGLSLRLSKWWLNKSGDLRLIAGYNDENGEFVLSVDRTGVRR